MIKIESQFLIFTSGLINDYINKEISKNIQEQMLLLNITLTKISISFQII